MSLDAEKAIERLHWGYLQAVLQKFGFKGRILNSILALYSSPSAKVLINGDVDNDTRQGCPLSPLIFALAIEPLAERIHGPVIGDCSHKRSLFADDILLCLLDQEESLRELRTLLEVYVAVSYYKLDTTKTEALPCNIPVETL